MKIAIRAKLSLLSKKVKFVKKEIKYKLRIQKYINLQIFTSFLSQYLQSEIISVLKPN